MNSEDVLAFAQCFEEVVDSDDESINTDPLLTPNIAEMISPSADQQQRDAISRERAGSITDGEGIASDKPKRKRRWRKKPEGWVDEPKTSKMKPGVKEASEPEVGRCEEQASEVSPKERWMGEDEMMGCYVYGFDDARRRPARVLSNKRGHALVEYVGGRTDAKSWIPVTSKCPRFLVWFFLFFARAH